MCLVCVGAGRLRPFVRRGFAVPFSAQPAQPRGAAWTRQSRHHCAQKSVSCRAKAPPGLFVGWRFVLLRGAARRFSLSGCGPLPRHFVLFRCCSVTAAAVFITPGVSSTGGVAATRHWSRPEGTAGEVLRGPGSPQHGRRGAPPPHGGKAPRKRGPGRWPGFGTAVGGQARLRFFSAAHTPRNRGGCVALPRTIAARAARSGPLRPRWLRRLCRRAARFRGMFTAENAGGQARHIFRRLHAPRLGASVPRGRPGPSLCPLNRARATTGSPVWPGSRATTI